ncbi:MULTISPECIES: sigma-70 family RNA polymerase sigma factor [Pseudomonas]|jgi:RNA polymerase sigma-70 factor (ECF subfamily)|uniref:Sigma-70 family RNA polymerase sigma factor n=1 Tax=Pseudomonas sp. Hg7Tf TaxID=3236988 RepID=A0AB39HYX1_9PSED|nr:MULTISPECIES: sigma-70 family RNA polymerase sigma factor [unclassified Pseudomonas]KJK07514.1 RNA polymerase sigma factor [Pseudomonas sp. 5]MDH2559769.1 sigma-70 family RNA polymerase sigma factor [Pseudomonas sp. Hg5Tf]QYX45610.1 sigma-70 family RNA polymerase sigma factor [Pseudomonas sp. S11A 273]
MERTTQSELMRMREAALQGLLLSGLEGNADAYRQFLQQLSGHLRNFLRKRLYAHADDLEDLLQEVLLAVHNARQTYQRDQPLTAWVQAIARYKLADYWRGQSRREVLNDSLDDADALFAQEQLEPAHAQRDLGKLLQQLPDKQRLPIMHVKLQGLSVEETAQLTGLSGSAVKVGIHRGLKAIAAMIRGAQ